MADLAIKGHATRGEEVIEILEMLGGKIRRGRFVGHELSCGYYINVDGYIGFKHYSLFDETMTFTLEEFLEKFPYKVGDKVSSKYLKNYEVSKMEWESANNRVIYKLQGMGWYSADELQLYKEAPMYLNEKANKQAEEITKILEPVKEIMKEMKLDIPDGYEFFCIDDDNKIVLTKKQPKYPKTYEGCCKVLDIQSDWHLTFELNKPTSYDLCVKNEFEYVCKLEAFRKLLICRDAYWKIAGEQMGLGKPWEPDYLNPTKEIRYFIFCTGITIEKGQGLFPTNKILIFPTEEMRDAFYENFRDLINETKELL